MSGVKWPHQTSPRDFGSIVDSQVYLWERQRDQPVDASLNKRMAVTSGGQVGDPRLAGKGAPRHPWLHYWGDAIVAELTRLGQTDEHAQAFLNDGLIEIQGSQPRTACVSDEHRRSTWISRWRVKARSHKS